MHHGARKIDFDTLFVGLEAARAAGLAVRKDCSETERALYVYSNSCVYDDGWNEFTLLARGLILHPPTRSIVATPFPKFFNAGERNGTIPDLPFEVFEKVDGSLAIVHHFGGRWRVATKGAFDSEQARWAEGFMSGFAVEHLDTGTTYLAEAVYPENRIVVHYAKAELVLLAAYRDDGHELTFDELNDVGSRVGWRVARRHAFSSMSDLIAHAKSLPATEEGFVIRFADGSRLKLKGDEYRRIHSLISRCTPLAMWEAMLAGDDMIAIRRDLPEEFWGDFDAITNAITAKIDGITEKVAATADLLSGQTDKEVGLQLKSLPTDVQPFIFPWRKSGGKIEGRSREALFRHIRPTGNRLPGYTPSYAMNRVADDATP
jgi:RNA ligase